MRNHRARWSAIGAAVAVSIGAGGLITFASASSGSASTFTPITPCRLLDTRADGPATGATPPRTTPLGQQEAITIPARGNFGNCIGLSATDTGAVLNVTIVNPTSGGFLTVWPADKGRPLASSLDWIPFQGATPNQVTTGLDASGQFSIYNNTGRVDVIVDVVGLYEAAGAGGGGVGPQGPQGPQGPSGPAGTTGAQGPAGLMTAASPAPLHSGQATSMVLDAAGDPVVSHYDGIGALLLTHCNDPACAPGGDVTNTVDNSSDVGAYSSLALDASGNPVIAYYDNTNNNLLLAHCNDPNCAGGDEALSIVDSAGDVGAYNSLALDDGIPVISYYDGAPNGNLKVVRCNDANCQGNDELPQTIASGNDIGLSTSIAIGADHRPVISYLDTTAHTIRLVHCNDVACAGGNEVSNLVAATFGISDEDADLVLDSFGFPVISMLDSSHHLVVAHCGDADCVGAAELQTLDTTTTTAPTYSSIALDTNGFPVVSYVDAGVGPLKVARCTDIGCLTPVVTVADNAAGDRSGPYSSLVLDASGNPIISSYDTAKDKLVVIHCVESFCNPDLIRTITAP